MKKADVDSFLTPAKTNVEEMAELRAILAKSFPKRYPRTMSRLQDAVQQIEQNDSRDLAHAFYELSRLEFFQSEQDLPEKHAALRVRVENAAQLKGAAFHRFAVDLIREISALCLNPSLDTGVMYRAFDGVDELLNIAYADENLPVLEVHQPERLYENSGVRVQTSYLTIFKVLDHLALKEGAHLIDLGSGFGRVGLAAGLWRNDLRFSGYEYVGERVEASRVSAERSGISDRVQFETQDLSDPRFVIPGADAYYLYDPFSDSTYQHVIGRLIEVGASRRISVIAKAGARDAFARQVESALWEKPESLDEDTILVFRSKPDREAGWASA